MQEKIDKSKLEKFVRDFKEKAKECKQTGKHKEIYWFPYIPDNNSTYSDKIRGFCKYCHSPVSRKMNQEESLKLKHYRQILKQPFNI